MFLRIFLHLKRERRQSVVVTGNNPEKKLSSINISEYQIYLMKEEYGKNEGFDMNEDREEVYSKAVKAGKRTYFFDVKATRNNDYYLTITESKKKFDKDGVSSYEKHKIFLYKEDFEKFAEGLEDAVAVVKSALEGKLPETN